jgi:UDP-glucose:(heptosyl)LPS alpha-1,3-glucosyltransferase
MSYVIVPTKLQIRFRRMRLTFVLFHYFPYGGLERDMLTMAHACRERGHEITIYTSAWQGPRPADIAVVELPVRALTNHGRGLAFIERFQAALRAAPPSVVVGFNKMPGLDVYYAADVCFAHKAFAERGFLYRLMPRARHYLELESAVFGSASNTEILIIAKAQIPVFQHYYATPSERMHLLAPGIRRDCVMPPDYAERRRALRREYALTAAERLILFVGSDYRRKGLDRALRGIAALDEPLRKHVRLWVVGQDKPAPFLNLVRTLGLEQQVRFLGARDDVPQLMWSADLLLHPAYSEAAGLVLLEAMVAGLPVIASAACGYAHHIEENSMGRVLADAMTPPAIAAAIASVFDEGCAAWQERSRQTARSADIFSMPQRAAEIIERAGTQKLGLRA